MGRAVEAAITALVDSPGIVPDAVGHRVVHGGPDHSGPVLVDDALLAELRALVPLAPLHQPAALDSIDVARARLRDVTHVACFDTAFHRALPDVAQRLAVPEDWWRAGARRYGFHGLSYEHVLETLGPEDRRGRAVLAHLGSGASLAAVLDGRSRDTTMGLTPTGGLVMATRSGDLDPGVAAWALRTGSARDPETLEQLLDRDSGLRGISTTTGDMRILLDARAHDPRAALAVEVFVHELRKHVGAMAAVLGGMDLLVFSGGIGERSATIRAEVAAGLGHLGVELDAEANAAGRPMISAPGSRCRVRVVPADEEQVIARHTRAVASLA